MSYLLFAVDSFSFSPISILLDAINIAKNIHGRGGRESRRSPPVVVVTTDRQTLICSHFQHTVFNWSPPPPQQQTVTFIGKQKLCLCVVVVVVHRTECRSTQTNTLFLFRLDTVAISSFSFSHLHVLPFSLFSLSPFHSIYLYGTAAITSHSSGTHFSFFREAHSSFA